MPSLLVVKKLAAALDTTMAELMRDLEQPTSSDGSERKPGGRKR
jgi:hypothetical protein